MSNLALYTVAAMLLGCSGVLAENTGHHVAAVFASLGTIAIMLRIYFVIDEEDDRQ